MNRRIGVIMAGGEGSRMSEETEKVNLPKHLLEINEQGETTTTRLVRQMSAYCDEIICTVRNEEAVIKFEAALADFGDKVRVIVRSSEGKDQQGGMRAALEYIEDGDKIIHTNGDLVFEDEEISKKIEDHADKDENIRFFSGKSPAWVELNMRMGILDKKTYEDLAFADPSSVRAILLFIGHFFRIKALRIEVLANVDTPESLKEIREYFLKNKNSA